MQFYDANPEADVSSECYDGWGALYKQVKASMYNPSTYNAPSQ